MMVMRPPQQGQRGSQSIGSGDPTTSGPIASTVPPARPRPTLADFYRGRADFRPTAQSFCDRSEAADALDSADITNAEATKNCPGPRTAS
jgi:hypothetical protein